VKDVLTGAAAILTAAAAVLTLLFEGPFTDTTALQKKIVAKQGVPAGTAKDMAQTRRRKQKLASLGVILVLAFAASVAALFVDNGKTVDCRAKCPSSLSASPR
jgi:hypothetical protein